LAVTSSDLFDGALENTHTQKDTVDIVDANLIKSSAKYLVDIVSELSSRG
jgi:aminopeptidase YwaD